MRREMPHVLAGAAILLALGLAVVTASPLEANEPLELKKDTSGQERKQAVDLLGPIQEHLSGRMWLIATGRDPLLTLDRPGRDIVTRFDWKQFVENGGMAPPGAPGAQAAGPGVLVPFRDPAPAFSRNLLISRDSGNLPIQTEPHIAVDPRDPDRLIMGTIDYNFPGMAVYSSIDGGATWQGPALIKYLRGDLAAAGDPVVAYGRDGTAYYIFISVGLEEFTFPPIATSFQVSSIALSKSTDGGVTWQEPVSSSRGVLVPNLIQGPDGRPRGQISVSFLDKPWIAVGPHPNDPQRDVIYITYTEFVVRYGVLYIGEVPVLSDPVVETTIRLVSSQDQGRTWTPPIGVSPTVRRSAGSVPGGGEGPVVGTRRVVQGSQPAVAPDGTVYVAWMDSTDDDSMEGLAEVYVARSDDAGRSFRTPVRATVYREPGFRPRTAFFRYWATGFPHIAVGPQGQVYVVHGALPGDRPEDDGDIFFLRSTDRGQTWDRPRRLNDDATARTQFFPAIAVAPSGTIHVVWADMRDDPSELRYHVYYTRSEDGGETWGFSLPDQAFSVGTARVSDFPSNPNRGFPNGLFIGDYLGIAASDTDVYMVWPDTRLGEFGAVNQKVGFSRRRPLVSPEVFLSPPAGAGGQQLTLQGFNFQPDMNVFIRIGGVSVAVERTDREGRFTAQLFVPISGQGAHAVDVLDDSGNRAQGSFFMEYGFGDVQKGQEELARQVAALRGGGGSGGPPWAWIASGLGVLLALLVAGIVVVGMAQRSRPGPTGGTGA